VITLPVYLDNHATTRVDQRVVDVMVPLMTGNYGNASSRSHEHGLRAAAAVEISREKVARLINGEPGGITFTSGATESINLALQGIAEATGRQGDQIVIGATEHHAVIDVCNDLRRRGFVLTVLPVDRFGMIDLDDLRAALQRRTIIVSIMAANNEIGTIAPLATIGAICRDHGTLFHTDATQAAGRVPIDVERQSIDLLSMSAHKMYGPKGIGALYVAPRRPAIQVAAQILGGGHEKGLRSGTLNVPAIAGFAKAAEIMQIEGADEATRLGLLRDRLVEGLTRECPGLSVNGHPTERLSNNANISLPDVAADRLMMAMKDICISAGSACSTGSPEPSHVLRAIGLTTAEAACTVRFGLGRSTTEEEIDYAIGRTAETVRTIAKQHILLES
jgi:cysteine desulfurase